MAYSNPRGQVLDSNIGPTITTLCACTLADYTAGGTAAPAVGDYVTFSSTGDWYVKVCPDTTSQLIGVVTKVELAPAGSAVGYVDVEWVDVLGFRTLPVLDLSESTRGNSAIKDGDTTVVADFNATATTGKLVVVAKSGTSGAGTVMCALVA
jgi:hypothetical protein